MTRRGARTAALLVAAGVALPSCGSERNEPTVHPVRTRAPATPAPHPLAACRPAARAWVPLRTAGDEATAAVAGHGSLGVVFLNDSDNDACAWTATARALVTDGNTVAVFDAPNSSFEEEQALSVAAALRGHAGVKQIVFIGASVGGRAALMLGADHPSVGTGVIILSAERRIARGADLLSVGRDVRVPVLSIGSRQDPLTSFGTDTRAWNRVIPRVRTLMLPGSDHGVEFLHDRYRHQVQRAIARFLRSL
jgi:pimeloyl-ACP methyl ester carboxylesterase